MGTEMGNGNRIKMEKYFKDPTDDNSNGSARKNKKITISKNTHFYKHFFQFKIKFFAISKIKILIFRAEPFCC